MITAMIPVATRMEVTTWFWDCSMSERSRPMKNMPVIAPSGLRMGQ